MQDCRTIAGENGRSEVGGYARWCVACRWRVGDGVADGYGGWDEMRWKFFIAGVKAVARYVDRESGKRGFPVVVVRV